MMAPNGSATFAERRADCTRLAREERNLLSCLGHATLKFECYVMEEELRRIREGKHMAMQYLGRDVNCAEVEARYRHAYGRWRVDAMPHIVRWLDSIT